MRSQTLVMMDLLTFRSQVQPQAKDAAFSTDWIVQSHFQKTNMDKSLQTLNARVSKDITLVGLR